MSCSVLHHVEFCVGDHRKTLELLCNGYGFELFAKRITPQADTWALRAGQAIFLVTKRTSVRQRTQSESSPQQLDYSSIENKLKIQENVDFKQSVNKHSNEYKNEEILNSLKNYSHKHYGKEQIEENNVKNNLNNNISNTVKQIVDHSGYNHSNLFSSENCYNDDHWTCFCCRNSDAHTIDSVFNIALIVKDVDSVTDCIRKSERGKVLKEPCNIHDKNGIVRYSIVSSVCGNIVHTLIDKNNYSGCFLPGYELIHFVEPFLKSNFMNNQIIRNNISSSFEIRNNKDNDSHNFNNTESKCGLVNLKTSLLENSHMNEGTEKSIENNKSVIEGYENNIISDHSKNNNIPKIPISSVSEPNCLNPNQISHIDHVTFVCSMGSSTSLMSWYEQCFGMKRFITNRQESATDGFVLAGDIGLRLKAMEYWRCAETGLAPPNATIGDSSFKLVIAEALPDVAHSNVDSFLSAHGGPGVQHIGLHTPHILQTVENISNRGVKFRKPPPTYYHEVGKLSEITAAGFGSEVKRFQDLGILIDSEADVFTGMDKHDGRYLMQIFSLPVFGVESFFLEIVQRYGAQGFGQGNIAALARSIQLYQKQKENKHQPQ